MTFLGFASGTYDLDRLDSFLASPDRSDDDMMIEQLDGFLTAIALSPRMMMPSEWLPAIWDGEGPVFADQDEARAIHGAILGLYNDNLQALADPDTPFEPILLLDMDDSVMIEPWAEGFLLGIALQQDDWKPLMEDEILGSAIGMLAAVSFSGAEGGESAIEMPESEREVLYHEVPLMLPSLVKDIRTFWQKRGLAAGPAPVPSGPTIKSLWLMQNAMEADDEDEPPAMPVRSVKVGRNEPCPCGSGKKYKRCCGA